MWLALTPIAFKSETVESLRTTLSHLPLLVRFAVAMAAILTMPSMSRRLKLPSVVGVLFAGIILGPHMLDIFGKERPVADFMSQLGILLLMFLAGLEVDLNLFRQSKNRVVTFGLITTMIPLVLGAAVGLWFGYAAIPAIVIGSLLASHTLIALPIVTELGAVRLEPIAVTSGATVMSDTLSLVVFAVCVSSYERGFSTSVLLIQVAEIIAFVLFVLLILSRVAQYALKKVEHREDSYFIMLFGILAVAAAFAGLVHLPGIVGAFLAGLAINEAAHNRPATEKLGFLANSMFVPFFFLVTGFLIDPAVFVRSLIDHFGLALSLVLALLIGKGIAAEISGRAFKYARATRMTVWSLTLPQVAATLAATLVGYKTLDAAGHSLIDDRVLNSVFVLMVSTSILGPIITQYYTPQMRDEQREAKIKLVA
jgi:Kef-type K+ transport system membrane component KefB